jgi:hypothetical protein
MIGLIFGLGSEDELSTKLGGFAEGMANFFNRVFDYIPYFPNLDVRLRFVILAWTIPAIFTLLLLWFTRSALGNLLTIALFFCNFCFFYEVAFNVYAGRAEVATYVLLPLAILGWGGIIFYEVLQWLKRRQIEISNLEYIIDRVVDVYIDVFPNRQDPMPKEEIEKMLDDRPESIISHPVEPSLFNMGVCGTLFLGCILMLLYSTGVIVPEKDRLNIVLEWILNVIVILLMLLIVWVVVMILLPSKREGFVETRNSIRRLMLRIILLILDCLYIPICQAMIDVCYVKSRECPVGEYLNWDHVGGEGFWASLYDRNVTCDACLGYPANWTSDLFEMCNTRCNGLKELHNNFSQQLIFGRDVMGMTGPMMIYAALVVVIGQPIWWSFLISGNRDIACAIPCYGENSEEKWAWLTEKLESPGLILIYQYQLKHWYWGILFPITKILCVILAQVTEFTTGAVSWSLLFVYLAILLLNVFAMPYRFKFNNILDIGMSGSNVLLTILSLVNFYNDKFPQSIMTPLTVILVVLPLLALVYGFLRKPQGLREPGAIQAFDEDGNPQQTIVDNWTEEKPLTWLLPIWSTAENERQDAENVTELVEDIIPKVVDQNITITSDFVKGPLRECQKMIDSIADGYSTGFVTKVLRYSMIFAFAAAGWFFGGVAGTRDFSHDIEC